MFLIQDVEQHLVIARNKDKALKAFLREFKYASVEEWLDDVELDDYFVAPMPSDYLLTLFFQDSGCETKTTVDWIEKLGAGFHISGYHE